VYKTKKYTIQQSQHCFVKMLKFTLKNYMKSRNEVNDQNFKSLNNHICIVNHIYKQK